MQNQLMAIFFLFSVFLLLFLIIFVKNKTEKKKEKVKKQKNAKNYKKVEISTNSFQNDLNFVRENSISSNDMRITSFKDMSFRKDQKKEKSEKREKEVKNLNLDTTLNNSEFNTTLNISIGKECEISVNSLILEKEQSRNTSIEIESDQFSLNLIIS